MKFLSTLLDGVTEYETLVSAVERHNTPAAVTGVSGIHKAHLIHSLCARTGRKALVLASDEGEGQRLCNDLSSMGTAALVYPARDFNFRAAEGQSREYEHQRLQVMAGMLDGDYQVVISCIDAALQYTIPPDELRSKRLTLRAGQEAPLEKIEALLSASGYERYQQVEGPGQFAVRGGILDFFTPDASAPIRVEFWGDEIDTLCYFDPETQRRTDDPLEEITLAPSTEVLVSSPGSLAKKIERLSAGLRGKTAVRAKERLAQEADQLLAGKRPGSADKFLPLLYPSPATLLDYLEPEALVFQSEPIKIKERLRSTAWQWGEDLKDYLEEGILCKGLDAFSGDYIYVQKQLEHRDCVYLDTFVRGSYDTPLSSLISLNARQLSVWGGGMQLLQEDLNAILSPKMRIVVLGGTERSARAAAEDLQNSGVPCEYRDDAKTLSLGRVTVLPGSLSAGFEYPTANFALITHGHFAAAPKRTRKRQKNAKEIYSLSELAPGDYIVHSAHGVGVFEGIHKLEMQGVTKDYLKVRYAKGDILYVPVTQLDMVSKYIGPKEEVKVRLNRLGGQDWQKAKARVRSAVKDIAKELIKLYAERMKLKGHAFPPDTGWQRDFESRFEYEETEDQLRCIQEIKEDMEKEQPMDRLLCGDEGFGKTEVPRRSGLNPSPKTWMCSLFPPPRFPVP